MNKIYKWMLENGQINPMEMPSEDDTLEITFKDLFEIMELYALQHQLAEFKAEIDKIFREK